MRLGIYLALMIIVDLTVVYGIEYDHQTFYVQPQPIYFLEEPSDHFAVVGTDAPFICSVALSYSGSNITWFYNDTEVEAGDHFDIITGKNQSTLTVKNITIEELGTYHCVVSDWVAKLRSRHGQLYVVDVESTMDYVVKATYESTVILPCQVELNENFTWLLNYESIVSMQLDDMMYIRDDGSLVLSNVNETDDGYYWCQTNEAGVISNGSLYNVTVQSLTGKVDRPTISNNSSSQYLLISPGRCDQSPYNQTVTLQCQVTGYPSPLISWYLNGEQVNFTHYDITDNGSNDTLIIQGGNPCRLIGYWQCFATNEVGTVHNEIRILPYGWSNPPGRPAVSIASLVNEKYWLSTHINITWFPPLYLGGLNTGDFYYELNTTDHGMIGTIDTYFVQFYDMLSLSSLIPKKQNITVTVHYNGSMDVDAMYLPSNVMVMRSYDNLICDAVEFKPPQIFASCLSNGTAYFSWNLVSFQNISVSYLSEHRDGWKVSENCKLQNGTVVDKREIPTYAANAFRILNLINGTICTGKVRPNYDGCDCGTSCEASASCTIILSASSTGPVTTTTAGPTSVLIDVLSTTATYFNSLSDFPTSTILTASPTTYSTSITGPATSTPSTAGGSSSSDSSQTGLFVAVGVLTVLFVVSGAIFCTVLYMWRRKSFGKYADIKFLKMSEAVRKVKPPFSENYCSSINICDESVCEVPTIKVMKWMNKSDFQQITSSESYHSLTASQMFTYICKNSNEQPSQLIPGHGYIDDKQLKDQSQSACNKMDTYVAVDKNRCLSTPYIDETQLDGDKVLAKAKRCELDPYCNESTAFDNAPHLKQARASLPNCIEECGRNDRCLQKELFSVSLDSFNNSRCQQSHFNNIYTNNNSASLSALPGFPNSFDLLQTMRTVPRTSSIPNENLTNSNDNVANQFDSTLNEGIDSGLTIDSGLNAASGMNTGSIEDLETPNFGYYELPLPSRNRVATSLSDLSMCSHQSDSFVNASTPGIQTSSLGYFELPSHKDKFTYFGSRTSSRKASLSELDSDFDQFSDISSSSNVEKRTTSISQNVDCECAHLPVGTKCASCYSINEDTNKTIKGNMNNHYVLSFETVL